MARTFGLIDLDPFLRQEYYHAPFTKMRTCKWFLMPPLGSSSHQPFPANLGICPGLLSRCLCLGSSPPRVFPTPYGFRPACLLHVLLTSR